LDLASKIRYDAERCVACGLCLPHCPTYRETRTENESPRGRIALMRALARDELPVSDRLESHLALCLSCRSCERVCPAKVSYGRLIDNGRALIEARRQRPMRERLLRRFTMDALLSRPRRLRVLAKVLRTYQVSGLQRVLRTTGLPRLVGLQRWESMLPSVPRQPSWRDHYPAQGAPIGRVALFTGCVTGIFDRQTLTAAIHVLNALGYDVHIPGEQTCCGALHQHSGELAKAKVLMERNMSAFDGNAVDAIISTASGCGAMLSEYAMWLPDHAGAVSFVDRIKDISRFVIDSPWPVRATLTALDTHVAVHTPCTQINVLRDVDSTYRLLEKIPGLRLSALPENDFCCGAAGVYFLTQAAMAKTLSARKLEKLASLRPNMLATCNVGCAMHLQHGLRETRLDIEVVHPIVVIARQLHIDGQTHRQFE
jgi:glycolate oxidase iron-sulfur subunit